MTTRAMNPFALQMLSLMLLFFSSGPMAAQIDTSRIKVDTIHTAAGGSFTTEHVDGVDPRFIPVMKRLEKEGWPKKWLEDRFADQRTKFIPKMVTIKIRKGGSSSGGSAYAWMYTKESQEACREFIARYSSILNEAEQRYGVDPQTIAALMRCETRHGSVTGDYHVFSVYASMALMDEPEFVMENVRQAKADLAADNSGEARVKSELDRIRSRAATRSKWAYRELINLLKIEREGYADAMGIYGSWAGAFGWSQFLPSSYLRSAVDGNGDSKIDLFNPNDAIHSVANYLRKAGYKIGDSAKRRKAIRNYNNSTPYVESIMALAGKVKDEEQ